MDVRDSSEVRAMLWFIIVCLCILGGACLIVVGAFLIHKISGLIVAGICFILLGFIIIDIDPV